MIIYKGLQRWYDPSHGGEFRGHSDFTVEEDETLGEAISKVFKATDDAYWKKPVPKGRCYRVHLSFAVYEDTAESTESI